MVSRKIPLFTGLLFTTFVCLAVGQGNSTWISFSDGYAKNSPPIVRLSQSYQDGFVIEMEIPGVHLYEKLENHKKFVSINVPPFDSSTTPHMIIASTSEIGKAKLPILRAFIAIPKYAEVIQPEVIASSSYVLEDVHVYPTGKLVDHNGVISEEFAIDDGFYSSDVLYPPLLARALGSSYLRDTHLTCLEICPFQYNPEKKQLRCYSKIKLRLGLSAKRIETIRLSSTRVDSGAFSEMCSKMILNYPQTIQRAPAARNSLKEGNVYYPTNLSKSCNADYLIITPDVFYKQKKVSDLASWRAQYNGFDVAVVNTSDIYRQFGEGKVGIRDFIQHAYEFWPAPKAVPEK